MPDSWRRHTYPATLALLLVLLAAGLALLVVRVNSPRGVEVLLPTPTATPEAKAYISGAVRHPGVYLVDLNDRVADLIEAAGGPTEEADLARVNLAQRLQDEAHIHVPARGEPPLAESVAAGDAGGLVNINTASAEELQRLKGIGAALAERIVAYRQEHGPFQRVEDLLAVSGIGSKTLEDIRSQVTLR